MGKVNIVKRVIKPGEEPDKVFKRTLTGEKGSPYFNVDSTGAFPIHRSINEAVGVELKKQKAIGKKIEEGFKKKDKEKKIRDLKMGGSKYNYKAGGRAGYKSGMGVCKLATKGKGRAYGKNS